RAEFGDREAQRGDEAGHGSPFRCLRNIELSVIVKPRAPSYEASGASGGQMRSHAWTPGEAGFFDIDGARLEFAAHGPAPEDAPTLLLLHEGLGCLALWRDFPEKLAA